MRKFEGKWKQTRLFFFTPMKSTVPLRHKRLLLGKENERTLERTSTPVQKTRKECEPGDS